MRAFKLGSGCLLSSAALAGALSLTACAPRVGAYGAVYATTVPYDIYSYPHVPYEGSNAYLVGNQWYYPQRHGWVVLRDEPPALYRYRSVQVAPPAPPPYYYGPRDYGAPQPYPQPYPRAPYAYPPPAQRVR
ncbi:MAG: hypothetical protein ABIP89_24150 [Polyangiaceae bacterium]